MTPPEVLLLEPIHPDAQAILAAAHTVVARDHSSPAGTPTLSGVRALVTNGDTTVDAQMLGAFNELEVVAHLGITPDNVDLNAAASGGATILHAPEHLANAIAEHALLLMLAVARQLPEINSSAKSSRWSARDSYAGIDLAGKRMGIIGGGPVSKRLAHIGDALDMRVVHAAKDSESTSNSRVGLAELLTTSDVVQICPTRTCERRTLFDAAALAQMKPTALLIKSVNAAVVDHTALADSLETSSLGGYGADVSVPHPSDASDRVLRHHHTVMTPAVATRTDSAYRLNCIRHAESVVTALAGNKPDPRSVFDPTLSDHSS